MALSVVIPTLNEAETIKDVIQKVKHYANEVLIIDGNSTDDTLKIAKDMGVKVTRQNGTGKGAALCEAFKMVHGDLILFIDGDGSMNPSEIPLFISTLRKGADVVKGSRFMPKGDTDDITLTRRLGNRILLTLVNFLWSANYTDLCYGYGAFKREALQKLLPNLKSKNFEIEAEIFVKSWKYGLTVMEVPSVEHRRYSGISKLRTFRDGLLILRRILIEFFSS
jgi:glycosyltransferase involved in cell wall biosynthesis